MNKKILIVILSLCSNTLLCGQVSFEFGDISMNEMTMKSYPQDSSARAVIIFNIGDVYLDDRLNAIVKRHLRVKFFDQTEIEDWANMTVRLSRFNSSISKVKASSFNLENGRIVETMMSEDAIIKSKINRYYEEAKFAIPNVKAGTVIDISYTIKASASALPSWQFQYTIPVMETKYIADIPSYYSFREDVIGYLKPSYNRIKETVVSWTMKDVPAFKKESYMTTLDDYISRIDFHLARVTFPGQETIYVLKDWGWVMSSLLEEQHFGDQMKGSGFLKKIVEEELGGEKDPQKIIEKLYDYVKRNVEWNEYTDVIPDHIFKKVLEEKKGSSSEINLLLVTMLRKAGINAQPVAISTRDYGEIRAAVPKLNQFNDLICSVKVDDKRILLDATDPFLPMSSLPLRCLNNVGLLIDENDAEWITIQSSRSRLAVTTSLKISETGELSGNLKIERAGISASVGRNDLKLKGEPEYVKSLFSGKPWQVHSSTFTNKNESNQQLSETHDISISDHVQDAGDRIYFNPLIYGMQEANPFKSEVRQFPVDFGTTFEDIIHCKIELPLDFEIEELPQPKAIVLPGGAGRFNYSTNKTGKLITVTCHLIINKARFMPEEYPILREFYTQVVAKQSEQIIIKKKK